MTETSCHTFGSPAWIEALRSYLAAHAQQFACSLEGGSFSVCEVYEGVPPEVNARPRVPVSWAIGPQGLDFEECERDDVDLKVVADWDVIGHLAVICVRGDAERATQLRRGLSAGLKAGTITASSRVPNPSFMDVLHDDLADVTSHR